MDREALGRLLVKIDAEVLDRAITWESLTRYDREKVTEVAERFLSAAAPAGRVFYARVSLLGHRDLGLCRVTEAPLAGAMLLRCETSEGVEWVSPTSLYSAREVPEAEAQGELAVEAARAKRLADRQAALKAERRAERSAHTVDVVVNEKTCEIGMLCTTSAYLPGHNRDVTDALKAHGFDTDTAETVCRNMSEVGLVVTFDGTPQAAVESMLAVVRDLGFRLGESRAAVGDELVSEIPF